MDVCIKASEFKAFTPGSKVVHELHSTHMPAMQDQDRGKKTLVLDLDETLVHSSFKPIANPDYIIPVEIEGKIVDVYVLKRPWLDHFMAAIAGRFEIVVFTASLSKYAGDARHAAFSSTWLQFSALQGSFDTEMNLSDALHLRQHHEHMILSGCSRCQSLRPVSLDPASGRDAGRLQKAPTLAALALHRNMAIRAD